MISGIEKIGEWAKVRKLTRELKTDLAEVNQKSLAKLGLFAEAQAVKAIASQELPWSPLSKRHLERKIERGDSEKTLIASSTYLQSITSTVGGQGRNAMGQFTKKTAQSTNGVPKNTVFVGVLRGVKNKDNEEVANIAAVLEYGSVKRNIPARPLWSVVYNRAAQYLAFTNLFAAEAHKFILKKHGIKE